MRILVTNDDCIQAPGLEVLPRGKACYWIGIERGRAEPPKGTELWAVCSNIISVTPFCFDYTSQPTLKKFADRFGEIAPLIAKPLQTEKVAS